MSKQMRLLAITLQNILIKQAYCPIKSKDLSTAQEQAKSTRNSDRSIQKNLFQSLNQNYLQTMSSYRMET